MASITIRNIDDELKEQLRVRAAKNGHSMEEEVRTILKHAVNSITGPDLLKLSGQLFGREYGAEIKVPSRSAKRETPKSD